MENSTLESMTRDLIDQAGFVEDALNGVVLPTVDDNAFLKEVLEVAAAGQFEEIPSSDDLARVSDQTMQELARVLEGFRQAFHKSAYERKKLLKQSEKVRGAYFTYINIIERLRKGELDSVFIKSLKTTLFADPPRFASSLASLDLYKAVPVDMQKHLLQKVIEMTGVSEDEFVVL